MRTLGNEGFDTGRLVLLLKRRRFEVSSQLMLAYCVPSTFRMMMLVQCKLHQTNRSLYRCTKQMIACELYTKQHYNCSISRHIPEDGYCNGIACLRRDVGCISTTLGFAANLFAPELTVVGSKASGSVESVVTYSECDHLAPFDSSTVRG